MAKMETELDGTVELGQVASKKTTAPLTPFKNDKNDGSETIDGDKVIAFIRAVEGLGAILNKLNVIAVKDAFLFGIQQKGIDAIIEQEKTWKGALEQISDSLRQSSKILDTNRQDWKVMQHEIMPLAKFFGGSDFRESLKNTAAFCDLLDRIEEHRNKGTLAIIAKL